MFRFGHNQKAIRCFAVLVGSFFAFSAGGATPEWRIDDSGECSEPGCSAIYGHFRIYDDANDLCVSGRYHRTNLNFLRFVATEARYGITNYGDMVAPDTTAPIDSTTYECKADDGGGSGGAAVGTSCGTCSKDSGADCSSFAAGHVCRYAPQPASGGTALDSTSEFNAADADAVFNMIRVRNMMYVSEPILKNSGGSLESQLVVFSDGASGACPAQSEINNQDWNVIPVQWSTSADPTASGTVMGIAVRSTAANDPVQAMSLTVGPWFNSIANCNGVYCNPYWDFTGQSGLWTAVMGPSTVCSNRIVQFTGGGSAGGTLYLGAGGWVYKNPVGALLAVPARTIKTLGTLRGYYSGYAFDYNGGTPITWPVRVSVNATGGSGNGYNLTGTPGLGTTGANTYTLTLSTTFNTVSLLQDGSAPDSRPGFVRATISRTGGSTQNALCAAVMDNPAPSASENWQTHALLCSSAAPESGSLAARPFTWVMVAAKGGNGKKDDQVSGNLAGGSGSEVLDTSTTGYFTSYFTSTAGNFDYPTAVISYPDPLVIDTAGNTAYSTALVGKIAVVGMGDRDAASEPVIGARRYAAVDGALDTGFGSSGLFTETARDVASGASLSASSGEGPNQRANGAYLDSAGRIVIAAQTLYKKGGSGATHRQVSTLMRLTTAGVLDTSFNTTGAFRYAVNSATGYSDEVWGVAGQSGGRYVVLGRKRQASTPYPLFLLGVTAAGALDTGFGPGSSGVWLGTAMNTADGDRPYAGVRACYDWANSAARCADSGYAHYNKLYIAGYVPTDTSNGFTRPTGFLARVMSDGSAYDTTFNASRIKYFTNDGFATISTTTGFTNAPLGAVVLANNDNEVLINGIALSSSGKIYVAGSSYDTAGDQGSLIARFNTDGTLDDTWSSDGVAYTSLTAAGNSAEAAVAVQEQADGRVIVAGRDMSSYGTSGAQLYIARFTTDGQLDTSFVGDTTSPNAGVVYFKGAALAATDFTVPHPTVSVLNPPTAQGGAYMVTITPDGRIVVGAATKYNARFQFSLFRLWP